MISVNLYFRTNISSLENALQDELANEIEVTRLNSELSGDT